MSVGTWSPDPTSAEQAAIIDAEFVQHCIALMPAESDSIDLKEALTEKQKTDNAALMRLDATAWNAVADVLSAEEIYVLMRFFTLAEMQIAGWEADEKSPVIWLNKILKRRGEALNREQVMWIKTNTRNRFLPNGAIL